MLKGTRGSQCGCKALGLFIVIEWGYKRVDLMSPGRKLFVGQRSLHENEDTESRHAYDGDR